MTDTPDDFDAWLIANDPGALTVPDDVWATTLAGSFDPAHEVDDDLTEPVGEETDVDVDSPEVETVDDDADFVVDDAGVWDEAASFDDDHDAAAADDVDDIDI
ncbi:hypothetical protein [Gordonia sp. NPDC003585]|uniref:hypothetical protein n=1 Tax=unclassified Gordonia (in: high G+C Gram-positive bacteria) TaxID=2657482 RepID=UPI0033A7E152